MGIAICGKTIGSRVGETRLMSPAAAVVVYGVKAGEGGLGLHAASVLAALGSGEELVHALGPGRCPTWYLDEEMPILNWHSSPQFVSPWVQRYTWLRWYQGHQQLLHDKRLGYWAAAEVEKLRPQQCYVFTQVGLETLRWAKRASVPSVLDNPNGHIRHFSEVCQRESLRWCDQKHRLHPNQAMVERVEEEYQLADRIRVSSEWAKISMVSRGVPAGKIHVVALPVNLQRFQPGLAQAPSGGPLRVCYVGSLNLAKGSQYLMQAAKLLGDNRVTLEFVGASGNRWTKRLFERERKGLKLSCAPGDPVAAYQRAEVLVMPSLHDGFGFVVAEAMACGLPVIVTEDCGAADWIRDGQSGWIVPAGQVNALVEALSDALCRRPELGAMGKLARADVVRRADPVCLANLREWVFEKEDPIERRVPNSGGKHVAASGVS